MTLSSAGEKWYFDTLLIIIAKEIFWSASASNLFHRCWNAEEVKFKFTFVSLTLEMQERKELKMHFTEERKGYLSTFRFKINIKYIHILFFLCLKHVKQEILKCSFRRWDGGKERWKEELSEDLLDKISKDCSELFHQKSRNYSSFKRNQWHLSSAWCHFIAEFRIAIYCFVLAFMVLMVPMEHPESQTHQSLQNMVCPGNR